MASSSPWEPLDERELLGAGDGALREVRMYAAYAQRQDSPLRQGASGRRPVC
jgi:hypothetical protein